MIKVLISVGTRPEAIKMAPVIREIQRTDGMECVVCSSGQHKELLDMAFKDFGIEPDIDLGVMSSSDGIIDVFASTMTGLKTVLRRITPDLVLVHGDTATTAASALAGFYGGVPVGHVEAGLRSNNLQSPWPEEANRRICSVISNLHFCPTEHAKLALLAEGVSEDSLSVTGNTVIDSLKAMSDEIDKDPIMQLRIIKKLSRIDFNKRLILITGHRRENLSGGITAMCKVVNEVITRYSDIQVIFPIHMNPFVKEQVGQFLVDSERIVLLEPLSYPEFVFVMRESALILTDSGGVQEEAPFFNVPVLVFRDTTERPEGIKAGTLRLVGTTYDSILQGITGLLDSPGDYRKMAEAENPYGDGTASKRIVSRIQEWAKN